MGRSRGANSKSTERPTDLRHEGSLPRYLWLAPPDEDLGFVYQMWIEGRDPREVWPDER